MWDHLDEVRYTPSNIHRPPEADVGNENATRQDDCHILVLGRNRAAWASRWTISTTREQSSGRWKYPFQLPWTVVTLESCLPDEQSGQRMPYALVRASV